MNAIDHIRRFLAAGLAAALLLHIPPAAAQIPVGQPECQEAVERVAMQEQRMWRSFLFGLRSPTQAGVSEVRHAEDGSAWIKVAEDEWRSVAEGFEGTTWSDAQMESQSDVPSRRGFFERRRSLSTELTPYLIQGVRTFRCRLDTVCRVLERSEAVKEEDAQDIEVQIPGCVKIETQSIPACHLAREPLGAVDSLNIRSLCTTTMDALFEREARLLKMLVEYDAAYRSVLQMSGMLEAFVGFFSGTLFGSLRSATNLITSFDRIPCFTSSCDDFPVEEP